MNQGEKSLVEVVKNYLLDGKKHTLAIYGHGASGKSTFAKRLVESLGRERVNLLAADPYIIDGEYRDLLTVSDSLSSNGS